MRHSLSYSDITKDILHSAGNCNESWTVIDAVVLLQNPMLPLKSLIFMYRLIYVRFIPTKEKLEVTFRMGFEGERNLIDYLIVFFTEIPLW